MRIALNVPSGFMSRSEESSWAFPGLANTCGGGPGWAQAGLPHGGALVIQGAGAAWSPLSSTVSPFSGAWVAADSSM